MTATTTSGCPFSGASHTPAAEQPVAPTDVPIVDVDPYTAENLANPYPVHEMVREAGDVVYIPELQAYAVGRYDIVRATLENWQDYSSAAGAGLANFNNEEPWRKPSLLLEADPPHHDAPRAALEKILGTRQVRRFEEEWASVAQALIESLLAAPSDDSTVQVDGVKDIAEAFPLKVFPDALGIQNGGVENLLPYGNFAFNAFGPRNQLLTDLEPTMGPVLQWIGEQCPREALAEDGLGGDIWKAADAANITEEQAPLVVRSLLTAGVDTTVYGIAAVLHQLAANPSQFQKLREDPGLIRKTFEETIRIESPVQTFFRTTTQDVWVGDTRIPRNTKVLMFLAAANRDPRRWDRPDQFDLDRDPSGHVGFGAGAHLCVGQHVARMEAAKVLEALLPRVERIELTGKPVRKINNTLLGWESLPLELHVA